MQASEEELDILIELQQVDLEAIRTKREFDQLPHRSKILEVREKIKEVIRKKTQVQDMIDDAEEKLDKFMEEDESLISKQNETQEALERVQGDFRSVESYSRDLQGIQKRRTKLSDELERVDEQITRLRPVMDQIMHVYKELEEREAELVSDFQKKGGALQKEMAHLASQHESLFSSLSPQVQNAYQLTSRECGGIAVSQLEDGQCSACRSSFDVTKINKMMQDAPIATCPSCRRLLIVRS